MEMKNTPIKKVGIIGAGMMGQGIAFVTANAGIEVVLVDKSLEAAHNAKQYSADIIDKRISQNKYAIEDKEPCLSRITPSDNPVDLSGCDLIIEAVFEDMQLKKYINQRNEQYLSETGIWASNTSSLPISQLARNSTIPRRFIGLHFFSPVDRMNLVEVISGENTADETLNRCYQFIEQIGKTPITVNDSLGFFTSRVFSAYLSEATALVAEGIHPERIEQLSKCLGMGAPPLVSYDEVSIKLCVEGVDSQIESGLRQPEDDLTPEGTAVLKTLLRQYGRGGRKHGGGFYDYYDNGKVLWALLENLYYRPERDRQVGDEEVKDRLLFRPVIESLLCLEEGVLRSAQEGNIGSLLGIGAPKWTGGYIEFVNTYGHKKFINRCEELAVCYGERFKPPGIVQDHLQRNLPF